MELLNAKSKKILKMDIKVSVVMLTYGHENFIIDAIKGVLLQEFEGTIELLISNDHSPDQTDLVINNYLKSIEIPKHIKINYVYHQVNLGILPNLFWALDNSNGDFIAICEGDDYWTDPLKIQKQVNFLKNNLDCNLVYHRVKELLPDGSLVMEDLNKSEVSNKKNLKDLALNGNCMHTPSVLFRNNLAFPKHAFKDVVGDYPLWFLNAEKGDIGYLPDVMAVYRKWEGSIWSLNQSHFNKIVLWIDVLDGLKNYTNDLEIKNLLETQAMNCIKIIGFSGLNFKNKIRFFRLIMKVDRMYILDVLKRKLA